jgi:hypothetical protein
MVVLYRNIDMEPNQAKPREKVPFLPGGEPRRTQIAALGKTLLPRALVRRIFWPIAGRVGINIKRGSIQY